MRVLKEPSRFLDQKAQAVGRKALTAGLLGIMLLLGSIGLSSYPGLALLGIIASLASRRTGQFRVVSKMAE